MGSMQTYINHFIELLSAMTAKELRSRYKYTVFGFFWLVANPLLQMIVIGFVFTFFMKEPMKNYYYYLFSGLLVWNFFNLSLSKATPSIVFERSLIKKSVFPRAVIPLSIIISNFIHLFVAQLLFIVPVLYIGTFRLLSIPFLLCAYLLLMFLTVGISLLTSALNVRFRDTNFFIQAILIIWFYCTPIVYSFSIIPYKYVWIWRLNPMTSILQLFQHAYIDYPLPGPAMMISNLLVIVFLFITGVIVFRRESKYFDDWI
jgi:lipopolysaccharide transport system permease protein